MALIIIMSSFIHRNRSKKVPSARIFDRKEAEVKAPQPKPRKIAEVESLTQEQILKNPQKAREYIRRLLKDGEVWGEVDLSRKRAGLMGAELLVADYAANLSALREIRNGFQEENVTFWNELEVHFVNQYLEKTENDIHYKIPLKVLASYFVCLSRFDPFRDCQIDRYQKGTMSNVMMRHFLRIKDYETEEDIDNYIKIIALILNTQNLKDMRHLNVRDRILDFFQEQSTSMTYEQFRNFAISIENLKISQNSELFSIFIEKFEEKFLLEMQNMSLRDIVMIMKSLKSKNNINSEKLEASLNQYLRDQKSYIFKSFNKNQQQEILTTSITEQEIPQQNKEEEKEKKFPESEKETQLDVKFQPLKERSIAPLLHYLEGQLMLMQSEEDFDFQAFDDLLLLISNNSWGIGNREFSFIMKAFVRNNMILFQEELEYFQDPEHPLKLFLSNHLFSSYKSLSYDTKVSVHLFIPYCSFAHEKLEILNESIVDYLSSIQVEKLVEESDLISEDQVSMYRNLVNDQCQILIQGIIDRTRLKGQDLNQEQFQFIFQIISKSSLSSISAINNILLKNNIDYQCSPEIWQEVAQQLIKQTHLGVIQDFRNVLLQLGKAKFSQWATWRNITQKNKRVIEVLDAEALLHFRNSLFMLELPKEDKEYEQMQYERGLSVLALELRIIDRMSAFGRNKFAKLTQKPYLFKSSAKNTKRFIDQFMRLR